MSSSLRRPRPTSGYECAAEQTDGWLYLVSLTGTTGARAGLSAALAPLAERARAADWHSALRRLRNLDPGRRAGGGRLADGVVVGSRALEVAEDGPKALHDYVRSLRDALDSA